MANNRGKSRPKIVVSSRKPAMWFACVSCSNLESATLPQCFSSLIVGHTKVQRSTLCTQMPKGTRPPSQTSLEEHGPPCRFPSHWRHNQAGRKQRKHETFFDSLVLTQLKELCKAVALPVSGSKNALVQRLLGDDKAGKYCHSSLTSLKDECKRELLVQTGKKYDLILRLLHKQVGTGSAKRAITQRVKNEKGELIEVVKKKRRIQLTPDSIYTKIQKKIHSIEQTKYDSPKYGPARHCTDTYQYIRDTLKSNCIDSNFIYTRPLEAYEMTTAVFKAYKENWTYMNHARYSGEDDFSGISCGVMGTLEVILKAIKPRLTDSKIDAMVDLLESVEATVHGWYLEKRVIRKRDLPQYVPTSDWDDSEFDQVHESNCFVDAIRILRPSYEEGPTRPKREKAHLNPFSDPTMYIAEKGKEKTLIRSVLRKRCC